MQTYNQFDNYLVAWVNDNQFFGYNVMEHGNQNQIAEIIM